MTTINDMGTVIRVARMLYQLPPGGHASQTDHRWRCAIDHRRWRRRKPWRVTVERHNATLIVADFAEGIDAAAAMLLWGWEP